MPLRPKTVIGKVVGRLRHRTHRTATNTVVVIVKCEQNITEAHLLHNKAKKGTRHKKKHRINHSFQVCRCLISMQTLCSWTLIIIFSRFAVEELQSESYKLSTKYTNVLWLFSLLNLTWRTCYHAVCSKILTGIILYSMMSNNLNNAGVVQGRN